MKKKNLLAFAHICWHRVRDFGLVSQTEPMISLSLGKKQRKKNDFLYGNIMLLKRA